MSYMIMICKKGWPVIECKVLLCKPWLCFSNTTIFHYEDVCPHKLTPMCFISTLTEFIFLNVSSAMIIHSTLTRYACITFPPYITEHWDHDLTDECVNGCPTRGHQNNLRWQLSWPIRSYVLNMGQEVFEI